MLQARVSFASGIVTDEDTQEKFVVVTGGISNDGIFLNSTEILIGKEWSLGKKIKFQPNQAFFVWDFHQRYYTSFKLKGLQN